MKMQPMSEHIGIEVSDIDLAAIDDAELAAIKDAVFQSGMVAVRGQTITPEQHIAFARRWGGIDINNYFPVNGEFAEIAEVRKAENRPFVRPGAGDGLDPGRPRAATHRR
jgi:taurine dioxygenase